MTLVFFRSICRNLTPPPTPIDMKLTENDGTLGSVAPPLAITSLSCFCLHQKMQQMMLCDATFFWLIVKLIKVDIGIDISMYCLRM